MAAHHRQPSPYKRQNSFEIEDGVKFFGRDAETADVAQQILSSRITIVHAPSGAGKTSLLNARIIPALEQEGWFAIRVTPEDNPAQAIKLGAVQYVAPPPEAEVMALDRAAQELELRPDATLADLMRAFPPLRIGVDGSPKEDPTRMWLIGPVEAVRSAAAGDVFPSTVGVLSSFSIARPWLCRLLSKSVPLEFVLRQWAAMVSFPTLSADRAWVGPDTTLDAIREVLMSDTARSSYRSFLSTIYTPFPGLRQFFDTLTRLLRLIHGRVGLVLIVDQFEEIFTRFSDRGRLARGVALDSGAGAADSSTHRRPDWRIRRQFFAEFAELYTAREGGKGKRTEGPLPIRYVLSLRDEYVSRLGPIRAVAADLYESSYRLQFLTLQQAADAISEPAALYDCVLEPACLATILRDLSFEDAFVEPGPLQIVCWKLYQHRKDDTDRSSSRASRACWVNGSPRRRRRCRFRPTPSCAWRSWISCHSC